MVKLDSEVALSVLKPKELNRGTLRKLIKLAGLTVDEFIKKAPFGCKSIVSYC